MEENNDNNNNNNDDNNRKTPSKNENDDSSESIASSSNLNQNAVNNQPTTPPTITTTTTTMANFSRYRGSNSNSSSVLPSTTTRLIRSFTLFDNRDFLPRPFQIELYEACKSRDTIVFLRPGQGRYFLAVMLVKYFNPYRMPGSDSSTPLYPYKDNDNDKKIFFLTKSLNSIKLYSSVFSAHSDLRIGEYLNLEEARKLTEEEWIRQLNKYDLHIMLDELFEDLIDRCLIQPEKINLLILDDAHKILLNNDIDCYTKIVRKLKKLHRMRDKLKTYRILGLSASILLEEVSSKIFERMIDQIETNLECSCETYADLRMINKYSIQSRIKLRVYPSYMSSELVDIEDINYKMGLFMIRNYVAQFHTFIAHFSLPHSNTTSEHFITTESICKIIIDILEVFGTLGEWCALKLIELVNREISDTITLMSKTKSNYLHLLNTTNTTLRLIRKCILNYLGEEIATIFSQSGHLSLKQFLSISSPKLHLLAHIFHDYLMELNRPPTNQTPYSSFAFPANICSLIYVKNRSTARVLDEWLKELAAIVAIESKNSNSCANDGNNSELMVNNLAHLMPDHVFLNEDNNKYDYINFYYRKHQKSIHEIYYYRQQEETLRRFRLAHNCNVLVTTSMAAEGLDVNRCNLVVCFDPPDTFHEFIQSKGRVRVEKGQFVVLVEQTNQKNYIRKFLEFCTIEQIFTKLVPLNNQVTIEDQPSIRKLTLTNNNNDNNANNDNSPVPETIPQQQQQIASENPKSISDKQQQSSQNPSNANNQKLKKSFHGHHNNHHHNHSHHHHNQQQVQLTLDNAISILNRYCNKLPSDTFTKLVPNYKIEIVNDADNNNNNNNNGDQSAKYRCRLYLPINSTYRDEIIGEPKSSQSLAKQAAAYQAVKTLKDIGELDQNYYPVGKETSRYIEKLGLQDCFANTKNNNNNINHHQHHVSGSTQQQKPHQNQQSQQHNQHHSHHHHNHNHHQKGSRYNRIQNRNIASKRRQYYNKKVADSLRGQLFKFDNGKYFIQYLYEFDMKLTYRLSQEQNSRGRRIIDPAETTRMFGIIAPNYLPSICDFTIYNRSGEVTITIKPILTANSGHGWEISDEQIGKIENFHRFTFENVLPLGKSSLIFDRNNASNGNYLIIPIDNQKLNENDDDEKSNSRSIDWEFIDLIWKYSQDPKSFDESSQRYDSDNRFIFEEELYRDAVVIPKYRKDKLQAFYYVAEICKDLTPLSLFPDTEYRTFEEYYRLKYGKQITNLEQPLLDVDHTSARLNLLTPRFLNRKGLPFPSNNNNNNNNASNSNNKFSSKRNPQQKQILVPELCYIHPFPASFWRKAVGLPCILYRLNLLLVAEELRFKISKQANIGVTDLPQGEKWPKLDFGWSALVERVRQQQRQQQQQQQKQEQERQQIQLLENVVKDDNDNKDDDESKKKTEETNSAATIKDDKDGNNGKNENQEQSEQKVGNEDKEEDKTNDPFSSMDDWNSFSSTISSQNSNNDFKIDNNNSGGGGGGNDMDYFENEIPPIEIISGPFDTFINIQNPNNLHEFQESSIVEVDDDGNPINMKNHQQSQQQQQQIPRVRAGSPTYWEDQAEAEAAERERQEKSSIGSDYDWAQYTGSMEDYVSINQQFSINIEELKNELSTPQSFNQFDDDDFNDNDAGQSSLLNVDNYDDFDLGEENDNNNDGDNDPNSKTAAKTSSSPTTKSNNKSSNNKSDKKIRRKPVITSLSDLDDDDEDDNNKKDNGNYSDFDLDSSDDDDEEYIDDDYMMYDDDFNFDEIDYSDDDFIDDGIDDDFNNNNNNSNSSVADHHNQNNNRNRQHQHNNQNFNSKNRLLSQKMNRYEMRSLIMDVLKIELLYDAKQIETKSFQYYFRSRFNLDDQCEEYMIKKYRFKKIYKIEKKEVEDCVGKIRQQLIKESEANCDCGGSTHEQCDYNKYDDNFLKLDKPEFYIPIDVNIINYDNSWNDIDFNETLLEILMKKIDTDLLSINNVDAPSSSDDDDDDYNGNHVEDNGKNNNDSKNKDGNNNNNDDDPKLMFKKKKNSDIKFGELLPNRDDVLDGLDREREKALKTLPKWLKNDGSGDPDDPDDYQDNDNDNDENNKKNKNKQQLGPHPSLILQAITMSNSSDGINLERLETVGDSFLKYSITAFLFCMCPELNEGKLSYLRSRQISNINLHRLGQRINLGQLMIASKFEPVDNWCPPSYLVVENNGGGSPENESPNNNNTSQKSSNQNQNKVPYNLLTQHSIPNKSIADCVEALIGTYLISSGSQGAIQLMDWLGLKVLPKGMKIITKDDAANTNTQQQQQEVEPNRERWLPQPRSPLVIPRHLRNNNQKVQEIRDKLQETYYKHHLDRFERIIGYEFKDRAYLVQAFTHNSYYENTVTDCYQRLEFLGDAVLDYIITRYLYEDSRRHSPGTLTDLRSALVNNTFFAALAVKYNFHKYLMMLSSELYRVIDGFVRKFNLYYNCDADNNINNNYDDDGNENEDQTGLDDEGVDVDNVDGQEEQQPQRQQCNYWELFISENEAEHLEDIEVPKALGDIFESVAGAIYLDSGMSLEAVWRAYYPMMKPEIENFSDQVPKSPIRVLLERQPQSVKFGKPEITSGRRIRVTVEVFGLGKFVGTGRNKRIAKCTAAKRALRALDSENHRKNL